MVYDISVNITDEHYLGTIGDKKRHDCDIPEVIARADEAGIKMVFLGINFQTSVESIILAEEYGQFATAGVHPCSASQCSDGDLESIHRVISSGLESSDIATVRPEIKALIRNPIPVGQPRNLVAIGEVGLDYHRKSSTRSDQCRVFRNMLEVSRVSQLPFLLHHRNEENPANDNCHRDFMEITDDYRIRAVVHSFTGNPEEMKELIDRGYYIGINGCSIRQSMQNGIINELPLERMLVETDSPYCSIRKSFGVNIPIGKYLNPKKQWTPEQGIRGRNEPINVLEVIDAIAALKNTSPQTIIEHTNRNFEQLFNTVTN